ncbi:MAG: hypothetical protein V7752_11570 [Halopseudomonas sp.]
MTELEGRWDVNPRWSLTGFAGSGWAADHFSDLVQTSSKLASGLGFQYLIARRYDIRSGLEVAVGPEDTVINLSFGSAWK